MEADPKKTCSEKTSYGNLQSAQSFFENVGRVDRENRNISIFGQEIRKISELGQTNSNYFLLGRESRNIPKF